MEFRFLKKAYIEALMLTRQSDLTFSPSLA
jgi:hypothetical protein